MAKILIVDNEKEVAKGYKTIIANWGYEVLDLLPATYQFAWEIVQETKPDIVLIDIELDSKETGKDLGKAINERYGDVAIIYFSKKEELAEDAWNSTYSIGYVSKDDPLKYLKREIEEALKERKQERLIAHFGGHSYQIPIKDILYIEADNDYSIVKTQKQNYLPYTKFNNSASLNTYKHPTFLRVHRSYIINEQHIVKMSKTEISLAHTEVAIPIGRTYQEALKIRLARFF